MGRFSWLLLLIATLLRETPALAKGLGLGVSAGGTYVPSASGTVTGQAREKKFYFQGSGGDMTLHLPATYQWKGLIDFGLGVFGEYRSLENSYTEPSGNGGAAGAETITVAGAGVSGQANLLGNLQIMLGIGGSVATIEQTGDTPLTQTYTGLIFRLGAGFGPQPGESGIYVRGEPEIVALSTGKELDNDEKKLVSVSLILNTVVIGYTQSIL